MFLDREIIIDKDGKRRETNKCYIAENEDLCDMVSKLKEENMKKNEKKTDEKSRKYKVKDEESRFVVADKDWTWISDHNEFGDYVFVDEHFPLLLKKYIEKNFELQNIPGKDEKKCKSDNLEIGDFNLSHRDEAIELIDFLSWDQEVTEDIPIWPVCLNTHSINKNQPNALYPKTEVVWTERENFLDFLAFCTPINTILKDKSDLNKGLFPQKWKQSFEDDKTHEIDMSKFGFEDIRDRLNDIDLEKLKNKKKENIKKAFAKLLKEYIDQHKSLTKEKMEDTSIIYYPKKEDLYPLFLSGDENKGKEKLGLFMPWDDYNCDNTSEYLIGDNKKEVCFLEPKVYFSDFVEEENENDFKSQYEELIKNHWEKQIDSLSKMLRNESEFTKLNTDFIKKITNYLNRLYDFLNKKEIDTNFKQIIKYLPIIPTTYKKDKDGNVCYCRSKKKILETSDEIYQDLEKNKNEFSKVTQYFSLPDYPDKCDKLKLLDKKKSLEFDELCGRIEDDIINKEKIENISIGELKTLVFVLAKLYKNEIEDEDEDEETSESNTSVKNKLNMNLKNLKVELSNDLIFSLSKIYLIGGDDYPLDKILEVMGKENKLSKNNFLKDFKDKKDIGEEILTELCENKGLLKKDIENYVKNIKTYDKSHLRKNYLLKHINKRDSQSLPEIFDEKWIYVNNLGKDEDKLKPPNFFYHIEKSGEEEKDDERELIFKYLVGGMGKYDHKNIDNLEDDDGNNINLNTKTKNEKLELTQIRSGLEATEVIKNDDFIKSVTAISKEKKKIHDVKWRKYVHGYMNNKLGTDLECFSENVEEEILYIDGKFRSLNDIAIDKNDSYHHDYYGDDDIYFVKEEEKIGNEDDRKHLIKRLEKNPSFDKLLNQLRLDQKELDCENIKSTDKINRQIEILEKLCEKFESGSDGQKIDKPIYLFANIPKIKEFKIRDSNINNLEFYEYDHQNIVVDQKENITLEDDNLNLIPVPKHDKLKDLLNNILPFKIKNVYSLQTGEARKNEGDNEPFQNYELQNILNDDDGNNNDNKLKRMENLLAKINKKDNEFKYHFYKKEIGYMNDDDPSIKLKENKIIILKNNNVDRTINLYHVLDDDEFEVEVFLRNLDDSEENTIGLINLSEEKCYLNKTNKDDQEASLYVKDGQKEDLTKKIIEKISTHLKIRNKTALSNKLVNEPEKVIKEVKEKIKEKKTKGEKESDGKEIEYKNKEKNDKGQEEEDDDWICDHCATLNEKTMTKCQECGTSKNNSSSVGGRTGGGTSTGGRTCTGGGTDGNNETTGVKDDEEDLDYIKVENNFEEFLKKIKKDYDSKKFTLKIHPDKKLNRYNDNYKPIDFICNINKNKYFEVKSLSNNRIRFSSVDQAKLVCGFEEKNDIDCYLVIGDLNRNKYYILNRDAILNIKVTSIYKEYEGEEKTVEEVRKDEEILGPNTPYELIFEPNQKSDNILELNLKNGEIQDKGKFKSKCLEKSF